jgi:hypothetical protein
MSIFSSLALIFGLVFGVSVAHAEGISKCQHDGISGNIAIQGASAPTLPTGIYLSTAGPGSGYVNVASTNFTVTLHRATFSGAQTVTLADGSKGGLFTPSVGGTGTSTVTVTPAAAASSFTFTYKPVVTGGINLTITNAQSWAEVPGSLSYTSNAPVLSASGPSSGNVNVASTNFTVSLAGTTFSGTQTVTIADGSQGGTFTPSVGTCASPSTCTVTPAAAATSFTYTYTPVVAGNLTLTYTNAQSWTNPSPSPYAATAVLSASGPGSGGVGTPSTNFTVSLAGTTFSGSQSVTITDGAQGGTFTPSVGSCGTPSTCTVTPAAAASSFTFTYTAALAATITLTYANAQSWVNPSPSSYVASSGFSPSCSQSSAALAAMSGLTTPQKTDYDTMICGMVTDGTWAVLDVFYYFSTTSSANALINLVNPGTNTATNNGSPICVFAAFQGFTGDATQCYLDTTWAPSSGPHTSLNSASAGACEYTTVIDNGTMAGVYDVSGNITLLVPHQASNFYGSLNGGTFASTPAAPEPGAFVISRNSSSSTIDVYQNGASYGTISQTSTAIPTGSSVYGLSYNLLGGATSFTANQMGHLFFGGGLTSTQVTQIYNRISTMNTAMGAPMGCGGGVLRGMQTPGPSATMYAANPYYTCGSNKYVSTTGSGGNTGNSAGSPWDFATAEAYSAPAGTCINLATGVYSFSGTNPIGFTHGGTAPGSSDPFPAATYVVWRCSSMPFSYTGGALQGEGTGCVIKQSGTNTGALATLAASYMMFDGLEFDGNSNAVQNACFTTTGSGGSNHHNWIFNSDIHDCGLGGIVWNNTDWLYVIHNHIHDNASTNGLSGSGISFYEPTLTGSYTPTTQDGAFTSSTAGVTFHIVADYNVLVHNYNNFVGCTDGEGIIIDDWGWNQNTGTPYAGHGLVMGNAAWFNGGGGVQIFSQNAATGQTWFVNNTAYDNYWSTCNAGTYRADIYVDISSGVRVFNNIAQTVGGAGILANNAPYIAKRPTTAGGTGAGNAWNNNIAYPGISSGAGFDAPNTFPTVGTNKNFDNTNPNFTSVTASSMSNNFALQAGSPAIGIGQAFDLWQQSGTVDAGACPYSSPGPATNCP